MYNAYYIFQIHNRDKAETPPTWTHVVNPLQLTILLLCQILCTTYHSAGIKTVWKTACYTFETWHWLIYRTTHWNYLDLNWTFILNIIVQWQSIYFTVDFLWCPGTQHTCITTCQSIFGGYVRCKKLTSC